MPTVCGRQCFLSGRLFIVPDWISKREAKALVDVEDLGAVEGCIGIAVDGKCYAFLTGEFNALSYAIVADEVETKFVLGILHALVEVGGGNRETLTLKIQMFAHTGVADAHLDPDGAANEVALAEMLNVGHVLSLCQLNRSVESRDTKDGKPAKPMLSDLRDSGSIEQDADMVWFIHRDMSAKEISEDKTGNYTAELIIAKFRNGQPGSVLLGWDGSRTSFVNLEKDANEQSLVGQYEANQEAKSAKKSENSIEEFNAAIEKIKNEIDATDFDNLTPPPETTEDYGAPVFDEMPDFSNVSIPADDDELF